MGHRQAERHENRPSHRNVTVRAGEAEIPAGPRPGSASPGPCRPRPPRATHERWATPAGPGPRPSAPLRALPPARACPTCPHTLLRQKVSPAAPRPPTPRSPRPGRARGEEGKERKRQGGLTQRRARPLASGSARGPARAAPGSSGLGRRGGGMSSREGRRQRPPPAGRAGAERGRAGALGEAQRGSARSAGPPFHGLRCCSTNADRAAPQSRARARGPCAARSAPPSVRSARLSSAPGNPLAQLGAGGSCPEPRTGGHPLLPKAAFHQKHESNRIGAYKGCTRQKTSGI
ncbi:bcl-2-binding component 3, isoforms 3/4-like [Agelaius tricolor]|uniref:bcl-2-binding component 3, isoforms 3/4-like n=1 Tax=Agelaius tricolor TaxID=9191 RepID=UPI0039F17C1C